MTHCNGNCGSCSGCGKELELTEKEMEVLKELGQIPFLPVMRKPDDPTPVYPGRETEEMSLILQCLEKKSLISLDFDKPLQGFAYKGYPIHGSFSLTQRGQQVLELMEYQGIHY